MLCEEAIRRALHASRIVLLEVANPQGQLGLEQLVAAIAAHCQATEIQPKMERVCRPIELPLRTWEKLRDLAAVSPQSATSAVSAGELAAAIIEQNVLDSAS
jgi:hypothetical protein